MNDFGKTCLALGIAASVLMFALSGCQIGDIVQVSVPHNVRQVVPSEPRVSFNTAKEVYTDWRASVQRTASQFQDEIDRKAELVSLLSSLTNNAMFVGIPAVEALPGGGLLATGLVGFGAWFLRSPGTTQKIADEKQKSFNKGLEEGKALARITPGLFANPSSETSS